MSAITPIPTPTSASSPDSLVTLEINANSAAVRGADRAVDAAVPRRPIFGDAEPTTRDEIVPIEIAQTMGYVTVGLQVDPDDWLRPAG